MPARTSDGRPEWLPSDPMWQALRPGGAAPALTRAGLGADERIRRGPRTQYPRRTTVERGGVCRDRLDRSLTTMCPLRAAARRRVILDSNHLVGIDRPLPLGKVLKAIVLIHGASDPPAPARNLVSASS